jgi:hypothetical protein
VRVGVVSCRRSVARWRAFLQHDDFASVLPRAGARAKRSWAREMACYQRGMRTRGFWVFDGVSDVELVTSLKALVGRSAWTEARLVAHLAEVEARRLHLTASSSLFAYCQERLGLSQNEAYYRIVAARMGRKFPLVFELLEQRKVHLTALALIRDYVSADNHVELLNEVSGQTKEQILLLLARREPRADARSRIRKLPIRAGCVAAGPSGTLEPLSETSYRLELCIGVALKHKLELLADLMSHGNPSRDLTIVVERALDDLLEKLQKQRFGQTARPRKVDTDRDQPKEPMPTLDAAARETHASQVGSTPAIATTESPTSSQGSGTRPVRSARRRAHISNELRRQLLARDGASCTFLCNDGKPCGARAFLQIHHDAAWAKGGPDTLGNLRLVCASHNRLLAEQEFGAPRVARAIDASRERSTGSASERAVED